MVTGFAHHAVVKFVAWEDSRKTRNNLPMTVLSNVISVNIDVSTSIFLLLV